MANDQQFNQKISDYYQRAIDQINRTIDANANLIVDSKGNHTGYQPVTAGQMATYQREAKHVVHQANQMRAEGKTPTYDNWSDAVNNRMRAYNATMRINRLELIKSQIGVYLTEATDETDKALTAKLSDDYIKECKRQAGIMEVMAQPSMWTTPKVAKIIMAQTNSATFSDRLWANQDALKARLDAIISNGVVQGQNPRKMATQLKKQVKTTVTNQRYVTERIARTESARVQFSAQMDSIKANGYEYVQWFAEIKACAECKEIARKDNGFGSGIYKISKVPRIPDDTHPNCRCAISETWVENKKNLSDNAPVSSKRHLDHMMKMDLQFFSQKDPQKAYGLTNDELWAMRRYVSSNSYTLNYDLRYENLLSSDEQKEVQGIDSALKKLPVYTDKRPLRRSFTNANNYEMLGNLANKIIKDGYYIDKAYVSTSMTVYDPKDVFRMIILKSKSGRNIASIYDKEYEVLFPRNTRFKVIRYYKAKDGKPTIEVVEDGL